MLSPPITAIVFLNFVLLADQITVYNVFLTLAARGSTLIAESAVSRRQILTSNVDLCTVRVKIFIMGVEP